MTRTIAQVFTRHTIINADYPEKDDPPTNGHKNEKGKRTKSAAGNTEAE